MISKDAWEKNQHAKEETLRKEQELERRRGEIESKWQKVFAGNVLELANDEDPEIQEFVKLYLKSTFAQAKQEKEREERILQQHHSSQDEEGESPSLLHSLWNLFTTK